MNDYNYLFCRTKIQYNAAFRRERLAIQMVNIRRLLPEHSTTMPAMANGASIDLGRDGHADVSRSEQVCKQFTDTTANRLFKAAVVSGEAGVELVKSA